MPQTIMEPKLTFLLAKTWAGLLNCHLIKNSGRDTKPAYKFMAIISLLAIELKATPNGNQTNNFCWRRKSSSLNVLCNETPTVGVLFFTVQIYMAEPQRLALSEDVFFLLNILVKILVNFKKIRKYFDQIFS